MLICYDREDDDTLPAISANRDKLKGHAGRVRAQYRARRAFRGDGRLCAFEPRPRSLMYPADDDYNAGMLDRMVEKAEQGCDIVCASRFMPGGSMQGCPWLKAVLVRSADFTLASHRAHSDA